MNTLKQLMAICLAIFTVTIAFGFTNLKPKGDIITQKRTVSPFTKLEASTGVSVKIIQGEQFSVTVIADVNQIDKIRTTISQGTLSIYVDRSARLGDAKVEVVVPNLKHISASSSATIKSEGDLTFDKIEVNASSGAEIKLHLISKLITSNSSSGATIRLYGNTTVLLANTSSGADLIANDLIAENAKVTTESGSDAKVKVTGEAEFDASSGSEIKYYGEPHNIYKKSSSGGDIEQINKD